MWFLQTLILVIIQTKLENNIKGVNVTSLIQITHLLFVDDVLIFGLGIVEEWTSYKEILTLFYSSTGMQIND